MKNINEFIKESVKVSLDTKFSIGINCGKGKPFSEWQKGDTFYEHAIYGIDLSEQIYWKCSEMSYEENNKNKFANSKYTISKISNTKNGKIVYNQNAVKATKLIPQSEENYNTIISIYKNHFGVVQSTEILSLEELKDIYMNKIPELLKSK